MIFLLLKNRKIQVMRSILYILNKASLPKVNRLQEVGKKKRTVNFDLLENKYHNLNVNSLIKNQKNFKNFEKSYFFLIKNNYF